MKNFLFFIALIALVLNGCTPKAQLTDTTQKPIDATQQANTSSQQTTNPDWVNQLINEKSNQEVTNPPTTISLCQYQNHNVYLVSSPCCDQYNYLYDEKHNIICAPSGGFTGRGDGKCKDFSFNDCTFLWKDSRNLTN